MASLKLNYNNIVQMRMYFKSLEEVPGFTFGQRRGLARLNESLNREAAAFSEEMQKIAEKYCEKDEEDNIIVQENGGLKIKNDQIKQAEEEIQKVYETEVEIDYMPFELPAEYFDQLKCDKTTFKLIEENFAE